MPLCTNSLKYRHMPDFFCIFINSNYNIYHLILMIKTDIYLYNLNKTKSLWEKFKLLSSLDLNINWISILIDQGRNPFINHEQKLRQGNYLT